MSLDTAPDARVVFDAPIKAVFVSVVRKPGKHVQHAREPQDLYAAQRRKYGLRIRVCDRRGQVHLQRPRIGSFAALLPLNANLH